VINIFVGNLDFATTEQELRDTFSPFGAVQSVSIVLDRDSGQPRGFAFVEMPNSEEAAKAVHDLDGSILGGRPLRVNEAREKSADHQKRAEFRGRDHRRHQI
jgi:RNA recognition motif-containing protein